MNICTYICTYVSQCTYIRKSVSMYIARTHGFDTLVTVIYRKMKLESKIMKSIYQNREISLISCSPCRDILGLVGMRNYLIIGKLNVTKGIK